MKLAKQYYRLANGDKKVNCYHATITKQNLKDACINEKAEIIIKAEKGKIIIQEK